MLRLFIIIVSVSLQNGSLILLTVLRNYCLPTLSN